MKSKLSQMGCIWGPREEMDKKEKDMDLEMFRAKNDAFFIGGK